MKIVSIILYLFSFYTTSFTQNINYQIQEIDISNVELKNHLINFIESIEDEQFKSGKGYIDVIIDHCYLGDTLYSYDFTIGFFNFDDIRVNNYPTYYTFIKDRIVLFYYPTISDIVTISQASLDSFHKIIEPFLAEREELLWLDEKGDTIKYDPNFRPNQIVKVGATTLLKLYYFKDGSYKKEILVEGY